MIRKYLIVGLYFLVQSISAQTPQENLSKIIQVYQGDFTVTVNAKYRFYPESGSNKIADSMQSLLVMHGEDYYFRLGEVEMMNQNGYSVMSDQSGKQLLISQSRNDVNAQSGLFEILNQTGAKLASFDPGNGLKGISIYYSGTDIVRADIVADDHNYITKCILYYQESIDWAAKKANYSKLEIIYSKPAISHSVFPTNEYGLNRFVQLKKDGTFKASAKYSTYQLTDNTN